MHFFRMRVRREGKLHQYSHMEYLSYLMHVMEAARHDR